MSIKYMLGCNYWGADHGTDMWRHYDPVRIREEMKQLLRELDIKHKGLRYRIFGALCRGEIDGFKLM